jgi:diguanylate cyclase (GGDEF)-like protein
MKILVAEDDPVSCRMLQAFLEKWGYDVVVASEGREALQALQGDNVPRIAILDWMMPEMDGLQLCRSIREGGKEPYTYILLLTARDRKQDIAEAFEAGVDDYLRKPFDANELKARLRAGRRILNLQESLISARNALQFQASHDHLTGLWNRGAILEALRNELARAERQGTSVASVLTDLDHFKRINDTYGHLAGDEVLREAARRMSSSVRLYDTLGRYGGEEFLVIMPGCDCSSAVKVAERVRAQICAEPIDTSKGQIRITLSAGVAVSCEGSDKDPAILLHAADEALYRAKANGRNRVELAPGGSAVLGAPSEPQRRVSL